MKKEIEKALHNLAVEGMAVDDATMKIIVQYDNGEISYEEFKRFMLEIEEDSNA